MKKSRREEAVLYDVFPRHIADALVAGRKVWLPYHKDDFFKIVVGCFICHLHSVVHSDIKISDFENLTGVLEPNPGGT